MPGCWGGGKRGLPRGRTWTPHEQTRLTVSLLSSCSQGDSGGPLVCNGTLVGVVSGGAEPCSTPQRPTVYTSICHYVDWIQKTMEDN